MRPPAGFDTELSPSSVVASRGNDTEIEISGQNTYDDGAGLIHIPQCLPPAPIVDVGIRVSKIRLDTKRILGDAHVFAPW